jgi:hypothetical protein
LELTTKPLQVVQLIEANRPSFFYKLFGSSSTPSGAQADSMKQVHALGLGAWSNTLYFDANA